MASGVGRERANPVGAAPGAEPDMLGPLDRDAVAEHGAEDLWLGP